MARVTSVIDIGSNSIRMITFRRTSAFGFHTIYEGKSKVRISENSYGNQSYLQESSMKKCLESLKEFKEIARGYGSKKLICVATSSVRDAPNKQVFLKMIKDELQINVKVIDGNKEAFLSAMACANLLHRSSGIAIDIGGGSTELAIIKDSKIKELVSLDLGGVRLKELFFDRDRVKQAQDYIDDYIRDRCECFIHAANRHELENAFGVGGSIRALGKYIMRRERYAFNSLHGYEIDLGKHRDVMESIVSSSHKELRHKGFEKDRIDSIRPGILILKTILEHIRVKSIIISGVGVREGVFLSDLLRNSNNTFPTGFNPSVRSIQDSFLDNMNDTRKIVKTSRLIFDMIHEKYNMESRLLYHLDTASKLYLTGTKLSYYQINKHGSYIALKCLNYKFSHEDRVLVSSLIEYSHKKRPKKQIFAGNITNSQLQILSFIMAISVVIYRCRYRIVFSGKILTIGTDSLISKQELQMLEPPRGSNGDTLLSLNLESYLE